MAQLISVDGNATVRKVYFENSGTWTELAVQPAWATAGGNPVGYFIIGMANGNIICYEAVGGAEFWHYNYASNTWSTKPKSSPGSFLLGGGYSLDITHTYAWGGGRVEKFDGTNWNNLTPVALNSVSKGAVAGVDILWCCSPGYGAGPNSLWYYDGVNWTNRFAELPTVDGWPVTGIKDIWVSNTGNIYVLAIIGALAKPCIYKYSTGAWTALSGHVFGAGANTNPVGIWGSGDSSIWSVGYEGGTAKLCLWYWNGVAISKIQLNAAGMASSGGAGKNIFGTSATNVGVCDSTWYYAYDLYETTDGTNWAQPVWPQAPYAAGHPTSISARDFPTSPTFNGVLCPVPDIGPDFTLNHYICLRRHFMNSSQTDNPIIAPFGLASHGCNLRNQDHALSGSLD
jgi:hypothetical protein